MRDSHETEGFAGDADRGGTQWRAKDSTVRVSAALADIQVAVAELLAGLESEPLAAGAVLQVTEDIGHVVSRLRAAHTLAIGQAGSSGMWAVDGYATATAWLRDTHLLDGGRARALELTAAWLDDHPATREAFMSGRVSAEHISAIRRTTAAHPKRSRAYPLFERELLEVAANTDPKSTLAVLKAWADAIDSGPGDEESSRNTNRRGFFLSPLADGWDLRGYLPGPEGAELAGVLNAIMETRRRESDDDALNPPATRRADALLDLARSAAANAAPPTRGRNRARIIVTVPLTRLMDNGAEQSTSEADPPDSRGPDLLPDPLTCAGSWRCGNGPGDGFLSMREILRLSCDGEIQRLVLSPQSQPLDIGRATRVVPPHLRTALEIRDRGCVMPGCRRPPSWCEAHHIQHWSKGGETALQNLALLCSRHHHELHNELWGICLAPSGQPVATRRGTPRTYPKRRPG